MKGKAEREKDEEAQEMKWKAENDLRTLVDAREIMADGKRHKAAIAMGKEKHKAMKAVMKEADEYENDND